MTRTGEVDVDRVFACLVVLGTHLLLWWMLMRATTIFVSVDEGSDALQVSWIEPPAPMPVIPLATAMPAPPQRTGVGKPDVAAARAIDPDRDAASPQAQPSMSAVFIEQGRRLLDAQDDGDDFTRDPFASRNARLPGKQADTFRMRDPISPQAVLRRIGKVFGGAGYTTDPCPQIRENIAGLAPGGDSELLQEELRRQRAYCH